MGGFLFAGLGFLNGCFFLLLFLGFLNVFCLLSLGFLHGLNCYCSQGFFMGVFMLLLLGFLNGKLYLFVPRVS